MMHPGLTVKLSVLLAVTGLAASGITGYYAYQSNKTMLVQEASRSLLTSTEILGERFSLLIRDVADDAEVLAEMPSSGIVAQTDDDIGVSEVKEHLAGVFASFIKHHPAYLQVRLITRSHYGLELIRFDRDGELAVRVPDSKLQEKGQFSYVFDTLALSPGHSYISPITINHELGAHSAEGKPTLRLAAPVTGRDGQVAGVVVIDVDLARLFEQLRKDLPLGYQVYLANEWGDFLVHPDPNQTFGFDKGRRIFMQDTFPATLPMFDIDRARVSDKLMEEQALADSKVLAFVRRPFGRAQGNRFVVLGVARPLADVLADAHTLGLSIIRIVLLFSLCALVLAILFARAITRPLHVLADAATHFFADHTLDKLPLHRHDEIGVLARCFDRMRNEIWTQIYSLRDKRDELVHLASHDPLTGLPNRTLYMDRLNRAIYRARAWRQPLAVMFVDLDAFKPINDQFGHAVGDMVLVAVATRLRHALKPMDIIARLGGDEFIVLTEGESSRDTAETTARLIIDALTAEFVIGLHTLRVGASIGISCFPEDGLSADTLLLNADAAMYASKSRARGGFMRFGELAPGAAVCSDADLVAPD